MEPNTLILIYIVISFIVLLIVLLIAKAIFSIPKFLRYQRAKIKILTVLAEKNGIKKDQLKVILKEADEELIDNPFFRDSTDTPNT